MIKATKPAELDLEPVRRMATVESVVFEEGTGQEKGWKSYIVTTAKGMLKHPQSEEPLAQIVIRFTDVRGKEPDADSGMYINGMYYLDGEASVLHPVLGKNIRTNKIYSYPCLGSHDDDITAGYNAGGLRGMVAATCATLQSIYDRSDEDDYEEED